MCAHKSRITALPELASLQFKDVTSKLESKEVDVQGVLSASENLKKELNILQDAHTGLDEENI